MLVHESKLPCLEKVRKTSASDYATRAQAPTRWSQAQTSPEAPRNQVCP